MSNVLTIGSDMTLRGVTSKRLSPNRVGYVWTHPTPDGQCSGYVRIERLPDEPGPLWTVEQASPLTLAPSLDCTRCGTHGWVREGRWVPV